MSADSYHKRKVGNRVLQPETQMMGYGFDPALVRRLAQAADFPHLHVRVPQCAGRQGFLRLHLGPPRSRRRARPRAWSIRASTIPISKCSRIGSRCGKAVRAACVFSSGMSAISTTLWAYLKPNDVLLMSQPLYGGTETLIDSTMPAFGIGAVRVPDAINREAVMAGAKAAVEKAKAKGGKVGLLVTETPANPTNGLVDLKLWREASEWIAGPAERLASAGRGRQHLPGARVPEAAGTWRRPGHVFADQVRRRTFGPGGRWRGRDRRPWCCRCAPAQQFGHAARSEHLVDDHALHGNAGAAHARVGRTTPRASRDTWRSIPRSRASIISGI